ncbi:o-succinylbenzoate synthase [Actinocorallia sp. API 0066]|uniref:o-succinylbenzoate synthase n=1 Tax=Actinocorallia sp. API 0066 TaxID=2896846 RepID=UPI001E46C2D3|nr:o-succinylbenzoate synthase [Actinocorallia sp. API 0066]MCD0451467.1 o-succinylbenzoate synthase [Actinocorallia sp. API 0066]
MKLEGVELRWIEIPLVAPFRTSFGTETRRSVLLVRAVTGDGEGWGECVAMSEPVYSAEYVDGAAHVIRSFLVPKLTADTDPWRAEQAFRPIHGHPMAKAAVGAAILDAWLRERSTSFGEFLGAVRPSVAAGVSVGIMDSIPALLDAVEGYLEEGYQRIKLKIEPGWDLEPVRAVRERHPDILLQTDANTAYTLADARHLAKLDAFDLLLIEQPLPEDDIAGHAALARLVRTPICLDESITSASVAADAITRGATSIINIKPGRVGGLLEARRVHDVCAAHGVPVWCGGMLETGIGRAANVALAALPNFTLPGDTSASSRYYTTDITPPFTLHNGTLPVPTAPGLGVTPTPTTLQPLTTRTEYLPIPSQTTRPL